MGLFDWLTGDDSGSSGGTQVSYTQSPEQQQVYSSILPMLQRLGVVSTNRAGSNPYLSTYNTGVSPWTGRVKNTSLTPTVNRANLGTTSRAYPTRASNGMTTSPRVQAMAADQMQQKALAVVNSQRIKNGLQPITMG